MCENGVAFSFSKTFGIEESACRIRLYSRSLATESNVGDKLVGMLRAMEVNEGKLYSERRKLSF